MGPALNIAGNSTNWRAARLSNCSNDPFELDGQTFASVEGFIQGIKFPPGHPQREEAFQSTGMKAKKLGRGAKRGEVWYGGVNLIHGSLKHHRLIERAIRAKFAQNREAMVALIATGVQALTYEVGHPNSSNTSLLREVFCDILTRIRKEADDRPVIKVVSVHCHREARCEGFTGTGMTTPEAIGNLIMSHPERFNLKLDLKF